MSQDWWSQTAESTPFDNEGTILVSENTRDAILETFLNPQLGSGYESEFNTNQQNTTSNGWVTAQITGSGATRWDTEVKQPGRYIIDHTVQVGQSDKEKTVAHRVQYRLNNSGGWITLVDIRDALSVDDQWRLRTGWNEITITTAAFVSIRIQYGQTDDGGTGRIRNKGLRISKVTS